MRSCVAIEMSGMTEAWNPARIYVDSNVFIYALVGTPQLALLLERLFDRFRSRPGLAVTGELSLAEVLPNATTLQKRHYLNLIAWSHIFELAPVSRDILIETAAYRKTAGMPKLPDAFHVVTAIRSNCSIILSADVRLRLPEGYSLVNRSPDNVSRLIGELS
jgi:predicted nucleic acid-binding protein